MDIFSELDDIGQMLVKASMLATVRQEVSKVMREGFVVTDGSHHGGCDYEVVVKCAGNEEAVARRLREKLPEADVQKIADDVIGLRKSRRQANAK